MAGLSDEEITIWRAFTVMRRQLDLTLERQLQADAGISAADYEILMSLVGEPTHQLRAGAIGDIIGWEKSRVSHQLTRMEQRGLIRRKECGDDARGVWVVLTDDGNRAALRAVGDRSDAVHQYFFDLMTPEELETIRAVSVRVLESINPPICDEVGAEAAQSA
jgi:DNA-binding MarR family transcriptional regulator